MKQRHRERLQIMMHLVQKFIDELKDDAQYENFLRVHLYGTDAESRRQQLSDWTDLHYNLRIIDSNMDIREGN